MIKIADWFKAIAEDFEGNKDRVTEEVIALCKKYPIYELLEIFLRAYDKTNMTYDKKLIFDQVAYEISKVIQYNRSGENYDRRKNYILRFD